MGVTKAVLVDAGGVIFTNVSEESGFFAELAARYRADEDRIRNHVDRHDGEYETGTRHVHEVLSDALAAACPGPPPEPDPVWLDELYLNCVGIHQTAFDALRRIRALTSRPMLVLANNEAEHWDRLKDRRYAHLALFDVIGSSWRVGSVKPSAEYFTGVLAACGCTADEVLFVDDNPDVVTAAELLGLRARLLRKPSDLGRVLAEVSAVTASVTASAIEPTTKAGPR